MPNRNNPVTQFVLNELEKKHRQSEFDHDYYFDVATGEVKRRLYVKSKRQVKVEVNQEK